MVSKTTPEGRTYEIDGRRLTWHPEVWEGEEPLPDVVIPLRIKLGLILSVDEDEITPSAMKRMLDMLIPNQSETLAEMDLNDFQDMFTTWQREYAALTGASLGESSGSPA